MKTIVTFFILLTLSFSAYCNEQTDKNLAIEFLKVSRFEQTINMSIDTYGQQFIKETPGLDREEFDKIMSNVMGWEAIKDRLADIVLKIYTKAELRAAIAYMKTPLGASAMAKNDAFATQFASLISQNFLAYIREHRIQPKAPLEASR